MGFVHEWNPLVREALLHGKHVVRICLQFEPLPLVAPFLENLPGDRLARPRRQSAEPLRA